MKLLFGIKMDNSKEEVGCLPSSSTFDEGGRGCRNKRRQVDPTCCPVCSITLRSSEVEFHLNTEIEKLNKLIMGNKHKVNGKNYPSSSGHNSSENTTGKSWETYQKVRLNRQNRQRTKNRKRKAEEVVCPVCNKATTEEINAHVELCLRRSENNDDESDENIDVEAFEEYEWAGQSRIRATTMLLGGVSSLGTTLTMTEEDEDLNVDGDDAQVYGTPQYSELDVIPPCSDPENNALRKAVIGADPKQLDPDLTDATNLETKGDPVLEVLKSRIKELEDREQNREEVYKCLICMERYRTPVISVCCWHVHCEQCWLQTLGAKKLCPQCNMITSPADLRRIYM